MNEGILAPLAPFILVLAANTGYHIISKITPVNVNTFLGLSVAYGVAMVGSIILYAVTKEETVSIGLHGLRIPNFLLGAVIIAVEVGWILVYRTGWKVSTASLTANVALAMILLVIGIFQSHDTVSIKKLVGVCVCIAGVYLING